MRARRVAPGGSSMDEVYAWCSLKSHHGGSGDDVVGNAGRAAVLAVVRVLGLERRLRGEQQAEARRRSPVLGVVEPFGALLHFGVAELGTAEDADRRRDDEVGLEV